ncbi:MAG: periplasmic heavy metal sensor [Alphaproteobacteria bacterium]|nr:periplasmic heavy metal sensor [Alphaproteobacteria bacterium]
MNKKLLITLGVSLALNFIFIGFEASRIHYQPCHRIPPARPEFMPRPMDGRRSPEQKMMQKTLKDAFKNHGKEMKEAMENVKAALQKEPFDAGQFKAALQKAAEIRQSVDAAVQESMVETISKMSPEERHRFAKQFGQKGKPFKHRKDMKGNHFKRHGEKHPERPLPPPPPEENDNED